mmetsp:Transcript_50496/g.141347  ORF Transcript_50496/g.141347 Transcript_50496/m.141347 type:complete len:261 (-) Transcript_50496:845-1627(-)
MNSSVVTKTFGAPGPLGNGHCSFPRFKRFPTPGGAPTATATVHSSWAASGNSRPSFRATSAVCSQSSRVAVMIKVSGAHLAHFDAAVRSFTRLTVERGFCTAFTPLSPSHRTPTRGNTRSMVPRVPGSTMSPEPKITRLRALTRCPTERSITLRAKRSRTSSRSHNTQPLPSASSKYWVSKWEPRTDLTMNSSPTWSVLRVRGASLSGRLNGVKPPGPTGASTLKQVAFNISVSVSASPSAASSFFGAVRATFASDRSIA